MHNQVESYIFMTVPFYVDVPSHTGRHAPTPAGQAYMLSATTMSESALAWRIFMTSLYSGEL
jgi:hypothetical protein